MDRPRLRQHDDDDERSRAGHQSHLLMKDVDDFAGVGPGATADISGIPWRASCIGLRLHPLSFGHDLARHRTITERSRTNSEWMPAHRDDDADVLGAIRDPDMVSVADFGKPARPTMAKAGYATLGKSSQRDPGALEYRILNFLLPIRRAPWSPHFRLTMTAGRSGR